MNKLQGFYQLKHLGIPTVPWQIFNFETIFDPSFLWTIRVAVEHGDDFNLPRAIGVNAETAHAKSREFYQMVKDNGIVIYYPYFIALKSGTLEINNNYNIIEAVKDDLWNLTTDGGRDVTIFIDWRTKSQVFHGNNNFLNQQEIKRLNDSASRVRVKLKDYISLNTSILLEWSFAVNANADQKPVGDEYLVFYECRTLGSN